MPRAITPEDLPKLTPETRLVWLDGHQPPPRFVHRDERTEYVWFESDSGPLLKSDTKLLHPLAGAYDILLADPISFPPLPPGREWHNPEGLTPEEVGEGWRPHLAGEEKQSDAELRQNKAGKLVWERAWEPVNDSRWTYRTRATLPAARHVELGPGDLPGGFVWLRCGVDHRCRLATVISLKGITFSGEHHSWEALANNGWQWTTDRNADWHPCSKEAV